MIQPKWPTTVFLHACTHACTHNHTLATKCMLDSPVTQISAVNIFDVHDQVETKFQTSSSVFSKKCITSQGLVYLSFSSGNYIYTHLVLIFLVNSSRIPTVFERERLGFESIIVVYLCVCSPDAVARNHYDQLCEWNGAAPHSTPGWYLLHTKDCCLGLSVLNPPMLITRFVAYK